MREGDRKRTMHADFKMREPLLLLLALFLSQALLQKRRQDAYWEDQLMGEKVSAFY